MTIDNRCSHIAMFTDISTRAKISGRWACSRSPPNLASQIFLGNSQWNPMESHLMKCISDGYSDTLRCMDVPFMCPLIQLTPFRCDDLFWSMAYTYDIYYVIYIVLHQYYTLTYPLGRWGSNIYTSFMQCLFVFSKYMNHPTYHHTQVFMKTFPSPTTDPTLIGWATLRSHPWGPWVADWRFGT